MQLAFFCGFLQFFLAFFCVAFSMVYVVPPPPIQGIIIWQTLKELTNNLLQLCIFCRFSLYVCCMYMYVYIFLHFRVYLYFICILSFEVHPPTKGLAIQLDRLAIPWPRYTRSMSPRARSLRKRLAARSSARPCCPASTGSTQLWSPCQARALRTSSVSLFVFAENPFTATICLTFFVIF